MSAAALDALTVETFARLVGESIDAGRDPGSAVETTLTVIEATPLGVAPDGGRQPFSVLFEGPGEPALEQGIAWLRHPDLGEAGVFLVPIFGNDTVRRYEAVFS